MGITKRSFYNNDYKNSKGLNTIRTIGSLVEIKQTSFANLQQIIQKSKQVRQPPKKKKKKKRKKYHTNGKHNIIAN
jgi:hypothetical protein